MVFPLVLSLMISIVEYFFHRYVFFCVTRNPEVSKPGGVCCQRPEPKDAEPLQTLPAVQGFFWANGELSYHRPQSHRRLVLCSPRHMEQ